jgi:L-aspartate oxidase
MGVERTGAGLAEAQEKLSFWAKVVRELAPKEGRTVELLNMLTFAHLSTSSALSREESRGVHHRDDFPETDDAGRYHTLIRSKIDGDQVRGVAPAREPVGRASVSST